MKVRILRPALDDLAIAREFYDTQEDGVGVYFFDSLFTEIDSLVLYVECMECNTAITVCSRDGFRMPSIIG